MGQVIKWSTVDALGPMAEEGRSKTAISLGELSSKFSRGFPNGETYLGSYRDTPTRRGGKQEN